ncbi:MAG: oligosaccharide flippase family protein [Pyrinomonadaceae bacterium]|nr:oligosaccharide flippase family protein [Pyrinomonadaceae bacterium]
MKESKYDKIEKAERSMPSVAGGLGWLVWSGTASVANSVLLWIFIARWRDAEELGRFTIVMGLYALFYNVCALGLSPYLVSEISRRRERNLTADGGEKNIIFRFIGSAAIFLTASGTVCAALMAASVFFVSDSAPVRVAAVVLSAALVPTGAITLAETVAVSFGRARLMAIVTTLENALRTVVPLILILLGYPMWAICLSFVAVRIVALGVYLLAAGKNLALFAFDRNDFAALAKVAPTFAGTIIFASLNWQIPIILLARLSAETESARFGVASRFLIPAAIFAASYACSMQPALIRHYEKSVGAAASYLSRMASYALILTAAAAMLAPLLSRVVLTALFGEKYADAAQTLEILAVSVVPFSLVIIAARGLVAANAQHVDLFANIFGAAIGLCAGLLLVPKYGAVGAATAQMLSFFLMSLVVVGYLSFRMKGFWLWRAAAVSFVGLLIILPIIWK